MAEILVLVDHVDGEVKKVTFELLTLARRFGDAAAVWVGPGYEGAKDRLAEYGAVKVYIAAEEELTSYVVAPKAELLAQLVADRSPAAVLVAATAEGKEIAGRLAVKTGSGVLTDVVGLADGFVGEHSIFGGAIVSHAKVTKGTPIIAVRPNSTAPEAAASTPEEEQVSVSLSDAAKGARVVEKINEPRYPSFKGIMAAKKKPVEKFAVADAEIDAALVGLAGAASEVVDFADAPPREKGQIVKDEGDGGVKVAEFLASKKFI